MCVIFVVFETYPPSATKSAYVERKVIAVIETELRFPYKTYGKYSLVTLSG